MNVAVLYGTCRSGTGTTIVVCILRSASRAVRAGHELTGFSHTELQCMLARSSTIVHVHASVLLKAHGEMATAVPVYGTLITVHVLYYRWYPVIDFSF